MSNIFFGYTKKKMWYDVQIFMNTSGYEDRDGEMCKTQIRILTSAYRIHLNSKQNTTQAAPSKKPPCFDELHIILSDKPTTVPHFLASFSGLTYEGSEEPDNLHGENLAASNIDMAEELSNST